MRGLGPSFFETMKTNHYKEIAQVFFRIGLVAFGGPAAHISMMESEIIEKRKWMSRQHFLDLMGATNLIPGPNSTEMTMHCGHERGGIIGLFIAGLSFILPAVVITGFLAFLYVEYGELPQVEPFIYGIKPAVLAIIAGAILKLGKKAVKNAELAVIGVLTVAIAVIFNLSEVITLLGFGVIGAIYFTVKNGINKTRQNSKALFPMLLLTGSKVTGTKILTAGIFWKFLKVGAILYGSGYVLFAYLDAELVEAGLMTRQELMDAIAVGQFTPGPVLSTATFIGYQLGGTMGAVAATLGIFLPSFLFVLLLNPLIPRMRQSKILSYFLDSVNVAAVGIMLAVLYSMTAELVYDWRSLPIIAISSLFVFYFKKVSVMWVVVIGSVLGYLLQLV